MGKIVFLVEEASMEAALNGILPRLFPKWQESLHWQVVPHDGKDNLEQPIPRLLRGWREPGIRFVILRDQDRADCLKIKHNLQKLCQRGKREDTLIRIPCRMLEAWFIGDLSAVAQAFDDHTIAGLKEKNKYRNPDSLGDPVYELRKLKPGYGKVSGAEAISPHLKLDGTNTSHSFRVFVEGLRSYVKNN